MKTIAIIDDDIHISAMLEELLRKEGYRVLQAWSGTEALYLLSAHRPDLILLDLMLPGLSGEALLPQIRDIPVIVVSAKPDVEDRVNLLMAGAVDYITKPFDVRELLARIAVHLRTKAASADAACLCLEELRLDPSAHSLQVRDIPVRLTRTEYAILKYLMQNPGRVVTRSALLDRISMDTPDCTENSLKIHISNLRRKMREAGASDHIEAVWGIGFLFRISGGNGITSEL